MTKNAPTLIYGIVWIIISVGIGWFGLSIADNGGFWTIVGWLIAFVAFAFAGMSLLHLLKGASPVQKGIDQTKFLKAMEEMAEESGRTHRGMVDTYLRDVKMGLLPPPKAQISPGPSGRGLFMARFFGALFMVVAYIYASRDESGSQELLQLASGLAIEPLMGEGDVYLDRKEARPIANTYVSPTLKAIRMAIKRAPVMPEAASTELDALADQLHEALAASIGIGNYTQQVKERFDMMIRANCIKALNHAARWESA